MERPNEGPGYVDGNPVPWPEVQGTITFTLPAGASDAQLEQLAELVRAQALMELRLQRRRPAIRVTTVPGAPAEPRRPGDGRLAATPGLWPSGLMGQQAGAYTWGADPAPGPDRTVEVVVDRGTGQDDQAGQDFLAAAERATGYTSPYLRKPQPAPDLLELLTSPGYVPPDKVGVPRLAGPDRSAWGRRLELLAAGLVGAILAWGASHLGR